MLYGRADESVRIERLLTAARSGRSGVLLVYGEPGIGKTALLAFAREQASDFRLLHASGVPVESAVSYAALDELFAPARETFGQLPAPQATALRAAFDLTPAARIDRDAVLRATHTVLAVLAADGPVLCTVDDAHWVDPGSTAALAFAARRLSTEGVVLLLARRDAEADGQLAGLPTLELGGLDVDAATALLNAQRPGLVAAHVVARLVEATGGNPLALLEAPAVLTQDQLAGRLPLEHPLPLGQRLGRAFVDQAQALSPDARRALLTAAAADTQTLRTLTASGAVPGVTITALEECEAADLVTIRGGRVGFRHPLARSAVYKAASPSAQREAHSRLAEAATGERRAAHLAAAATGADEAAAAELEGVGERALARTGFLTAAHWLEQAAGLTAAGPERARRLVRAAKMSLLAGLPERAAELARAAEEQTDDPALLADLSHVTAVLAAAEHPDAAALEEAERRLALAAPVIDLDDRGDSVDQGVAAARALEAGWFLPRALVRRAKLRVSAGSWLEAEADAAEASRLAAGARQRRIRADAGALLAGLEARRGRVDECLTRLSEMVSSCDVVETRALRLATVGLLDLGIGRVTDAIAELEEALALTAGAILADRGALTTAVDLVEAYVRAGRPAEAKRAAERGGAWTRALAAPDGEYAPLFEEALAALGDPDGLPFERARIELSHGERLRRSRARTDAREHLRAAHALFELLGATPWAERARAELRATGETARRRDAGTLDDLTPQELEVLRAIAAGKTNNEAARSLFLSPKTVEFHIGKVYRKLGVRSRRELPAVLGRLRAEGVDVPPSG